MTFNVDAFLADAYRDCIREESDLREEQVEAIDWLLKQRAGLLLADVGTGKTAIIETLLDRLFLNGYTGKVLVIAPIRVGNRVWMQEHRLWQHLAYLNPVMLRIADDDPRLAGFKGSRKTIRKHGLRNQLLSSPNQIHVVNREAVSWLVGRFVELERKGKLRELAPWPYPIVIVDEASVLGNHNNEIFTALKRVRHRIKRFYELTASPASQTYMKFFSLSYLLDEGERLGKNITTFRERYFSYNQYSMRWNLRPEADKEIEARISDLCFVIRRETNFQVMTRRIQLPAAIKGKYDDFERDAILEIGDVEIEGITAAALSNKLLQFASGAVYDDKKHAHLIHDEKIEELKQLAEETLDHPIMVAYWYKSTLARLRKAFPQALIADSEGKFEADWNKRKFKLMFGHPRSIGHGLNLQFGGHHIAIFDMFWPLDLFLQFIGRLDRPPQANTVMVHLLSAVGTHDEAVSQNLERLRRAEETMKQRLRDLQRKYGNVSQHDQHREVSEL